MSLQKLSNDFIPYACLFNKSTCLTKKGELFQVLEINLHDLKDNSENGIRQSFRDHISNNLPDYENYAFWIYTIKQKSLDISTDNQKIEDLLFLNHLNEDMRKIKKNINSFAIKIFICIFYKSIHQKISFFDLIATFSDKITIKRELRSLENSSILLSKAVDNLVNTLSKYSPKILSSYMSNNVEYSELINFLGFFVNLNHTEYKTAPIDISEQINNSQYNFDDQNIIIQNDTRKICNIFSIKDRPSISVKSCSNILSIPGEIIICEHFIYCKKDEIQKILSTKEFVLNDETKNKRLLKAATYIALISEDFQNMKIMLHFMSQRLSSYGVLAVMEDISKDKIFHAIKPGNFKFIDRLSYDVEDNVATFLYGYVSQTKVYKDILFDKPILTLPSLKQNPIDIKIDINNRNIIISGQEKSGKTTISNIINAALYQELKTKLFILELSDKSSAFVKAMDGENYIASVDKFKNTIFFNISKIIKSMESSFAIEYIRDILLLMTSYGNLKVNDQIIHEINTISVKIYDNIKKQENNSYYFHHFKEYLKDSIIEAEIAKWHSIGKYSHFFDNLEDFLIDTEKNVFRIQLDHTIYQNDIMSTIIIYNILINILYNPDNKNSIIVINNPFYLMRNHFFNNKIKGLIKIASDRKIIIIFKNNQLNINQNSANDFSAIIESSGLAIHFGGNLINQEYGNFFKLEKYEQNALNTLSKIKFSFIIKEKNDTFSINCNLSQFNKMLHLLSGGDAVEKELNKIKDIINNNNINNIIRIYYENQKIDISIDNNPFEQSIISSEIEKILS